MKIKVLESDYDSVMAMPRNRHIKPIKPSKAIRTLLKTASAGALKKANFKLYENEGQQCRSLQAAHQARFLPQPQEQAFLE